MTHHLISRRKFVSAGALAISGLASSGMPRPFLPRNKEQAIRIALIGCGSRGTGLATLIKAMDAFRLVACCDTLPDHLQNGLEQAEKGAKGYSDFKSLLDDKNVDAVIIATPLYMHYPIAIAALEAGKHVYLEKSMTYDIPQAIDLAKKVKNYNLIFQVGYQYRYYGLYHRVKEIIDQNWLGRITHLSCQYNRNSNWRNPLPDPKLERQINWRMYREYCGGPLSELCAHEIDMVNYLLNEHPVQVVGLGGINYWKDGRDTYDHIHTMYEYPGGITANFSSVLSNAYDGYSIKIMGDKATVVIQRDQAFIYAESTENKKGIVDGVTGATIAATTQGKPVEIQFKKPGEKDTEPTEFALHDFADCIRTKKNPASNADTAKETSIAIHLGNMAADTRLVQSWKPEYSV